MGRRVDAAGAPAAVAGDGQPAGGDRAKKLRAEAEGKRVRGSYSKESWGRGMPAP
eukprot:gene30065-15996_t